MWTVVKSCVRYECVVACMVICIHVSERVHLCGPCTAVSSLCICLSSVFVHVYIHTYTHTYTRIYSIISSLGMNPRSGYFYQFGLLAHVDAHPPDRWATYSRPPSRVSFSTCEIMSKLLSHKDGHNMEDLHLE
jgi:hypothetical protein